VTVRFGSCELDAARRQLLRDGRETHLTPKAFELLILLVDAAPRVVKKAELHERLWPNGIVSDAMLVGLIKEIRRALDDRNKAMPMIRTVHRVGYAFAAPLTRAPRQPSVSRWLVTGERRIVLIDGDNVIGRDPEANVQLDYATVSRRHARVVVTATSTVLEDLGSKNGTTIGGTKLAAPVELRDGDRFACGQVLLVYRESRAGFPTATHVDIPNAAISRR
jgi:DNA-binding winged helix-turn-helix (wHTH) protein